jgi:uncharacterized membrane protein
MAEAEGGFSKARLEAFSDGVIAVIITIMVLELKAPENDNLEDLLKLWPSLSIYLISFTFVAIYWINHHNILTLARRVTPGLIWANNVLLLFLSLIPFATAYVANTHLASLPTMLYAGLQLLCGLAFALTFSTIAAQRRDDASFMAAARARGAKNQLAVVAYAVSIVAAWFSPLSALLIFVAVAIGYVVPTLFTEPVSARARR